MGDVMKVPIKDHRASLGENNLVFAKVAVTSTRKARVKKWCGGFQAFEQLLGSDHPSTVCLGEQSAFTFRARKKPRDPRGSTGGRG